MIRRKNFPTEESLFLRAAEETGRREDLGANFFQPALADDLFFAFFFMAS
tara:strand:- start:36 stop:185 length:150 start_codon:yes stop_codon:yes gene_type:complete